MVEVSKEGVNVSDPFKTCGEKSRCRSVELQEVLLMHLSISHAEDRIF